MKTKITFNSETEGDDYKLKQCMKSNDMAHALWEIVRLKKKLNQRFEALDNTNNDVFDGISDSFTAIHDVLDRFNINVEELID